MRKVKAFYWDDRPNFGDRLTPHLLQRFSGVESEWSDVGDADVVATGSILEHVPEGWGGCVLGSGRLHENSGLHLAKASVMALRGPLSAAGVPGDYALGDPGLLADELVTVETRDITLGLLPHWSDTSLKYDHRFQPYHPVLIRPWEDVLSVLGMIGRCQKIVTSSLHGLIVADAFGIPRRFEPAPRFGVVPHEGGVFKFRDYNASVGLPFKVGETQRARWQVVEDRKSGLYDAFRAFGRIA